jgi:hypothetical protein
MPEMSSWLRYQYLGNKLNAKSNAFNMAPSVAEADAILAGFGYAKPVAIAA